MREADQSNVTGVEHRSMGHEHDDQFGGVRPDDPPIMKSNAPNTRYHGNGTNGFLHFATN